MFGHHVREIVAVRCKCMANHDREQNEAKFSGKSSQTKDYKASGCYGGDILLKNQEFDSWERN